MTEKKEEFRVLKKRKHVSDSITIKRKCGCGNIYGTIAYDDETYRINKVSFELGRSGSCRASNMAALSELISLLFQGNYDPEVIIDRLKNIACGTPYIIEEKAECSLSCADTIARTLEDAVEILGERREREEKKDADKDTKKD